MKRNRASIDRLGELQRLVLEVVWEMGEATVHQVRDRLHPKRPLAYTTILTSMQKLERNGWLTHRREGRIYIYRPTETRTQAAVRSVRQMVKGLFKGDSRVLLQQLIQEEPLSKKDLDELRKMLDRRRKEIRDE